MANREIYRLKTFHSTEVFLSGDAKSILHGAVENIPADYIPIYATFDDDNVYLFFVKDARVRYIKSITDSKKFVVDDKPVPIDVVQNNDGSVTIKQGNRFVSFRQATGLIDLRPKNLAWEHFGFVKTELTISDVEEKNVESSVSEAHYRCKVSIIVPAIDAAPINPALGSIVKQTLTDYEVIVVDGLRADDATLDKTLGVNFKNQLGNKLSIVKAGANALTLGALYNVGINFAGGRYVLLITGGDEIAPTALQELYTIADRMNFDAVYCTGVESPTRVQYDVANRIHLFVNGRLGMSARGRLISREFLVRNQIEFPRLKAADEMVYSFELACLARNYVLVSDALWKFGAEPEESAEELSFFMVTNEAFEVLDKFMNEQEFFSRSPEYRYVVLNCINEHCKKYLRRGKMTPYEFYEAVLKEVKANRVAFNRTAFLAYNFCTANWQYAQILKKDREIRALNEEIKKAKELQAQAKKEQ